MLSRLNAKYHYWHLFIAVAVLHTLLKSIALLTQLVFASHRSVPFDVSGLLNQATWSAVTRSLRIFVLREFWAMFFTHGFVFAVVGFSLFPSAFERFSTLCKTKFSGYFDTENDTMISFFFYLAYQTFATLIIVPVSIVWTVRRWEVLIPKITDLLVKDFTGHLGVLLCLQVFSRRKLFTMVVASVVYLVYMLHHNLGALGEDLNAGVPFQVNANTAGIVALLQRFGFPLSRVALLPGVVNAYTSGWGSWAIIMIGTGLQAVGMSPKVIEAVVAHELAHWKYYHLAVEVAIVYLLKMMKIFALIYIIDNLKFYQAFGFKEFKDNKVLPIGIGLILFDLIIAQLSGLTTPIWNGLHWVKEYQADAFAAQLGYGPDLVQFAQILGQATNYSDLMTTFCGLFYFDHPVFINRIVALQKLI